MTYSPAIEKLIEEKMNGLVKKTRAQAILYCKEFFPETARIMRKEEFKKL